MTTTGQVTLGSARETSALRLPLLLALWMFAGVVLLTFLGGPPVSRTQEARVLETAREMLQSGDWRQWLIPMLGGRPRLEKPPLSYWLVAASFRVGGVNETAGRIPNALAGWLTIGLTFLVARSLFDDDAVGLVSSGVLLSSFIFFRFTRLAETDAMVMLFITLAVHALWRGAVTGRAVWLHAFAAAAALVVLAKGAPIVFVLVFLIAFCWLHKRWDLLRRLLTSGAVVTFLVIACPWFVYVIAHAGLRVFLHEIRNTAEGGDHWSGPWVYIPGLLLACAPWCGFMPLALLDALRRWRSDTGARVTLLWFGSILVPLCIIGNKQNHYLIMLTPPLAILIGRLLVTWPADIRGWLKAVFLGTLIVLAVGGLCAPLAGTLTRGEQTRLDWLTGAALAIAVGVVLVATVSRGVRAGVVMLLVTACLVMPFLAGRWMPTLTHGNMRDAAAEIRGKFSDGPYLFYGPNTSVTLCFALHRSIPQAQTAEELAALSRPGSVVIAVFKNDRSPPPLPEQFTHQAQIEVRELTLDLYQQQSPMPTTTSAAPLTTGSSFPEP